MPDRFTPAERSAVMARVRSSGSRAEIALEGLVRANLDPACEVETQRSDLPGRPDIVVPSLSLCFFVDGCFWHQCPLHRSMPQNNRAYWEAKLARNVARDRRSRRQLRADGWSVWRVWEHDLRPTRLPATERRVAGILRRRADETGAT